jgi:hypothetical protein
MESLITKLFPNIIVPMTRTKGVAMPITPTDFLKKRYDRARCSGVFDVSLLHWINCLSIPFLRLLERGELFSSHKQDTKTEPI